MRKLGIGLLALLALSCAPDSSAPKPYPSKTLFVYIFSSQGGGTDQWARLMAPIIGRQLGVNMVCNNLPGANGGTGAMKVWNAPHDGYSILGASETSMFFGVNDVAPLADRWEYFLGGGSPGIVAVRSDSPYASIQDFVEAARRQPKSVKIANSGQGKLWHIKAAQLQKAADAEFQHVPYNGSGPAITALLSKEVDAVSCSAGEAGEYIRGGMLRPLVATEAEGVAFEGFGAAPAAGELYPSAAEDFDSLFQWLGFMLPADTPAEALEAFGRAFDMAMDDPKTEELIRMQNMRKIGLRGPAAKELALKMQSAASWASFELGLAKKTPEELGMPKP